MKADSFLYTSEKGWSVTPFPALDSESTLVLVFGAPEFIDKPAPIAEITRAYPQSIMVGCSTAGEILGTSLHDDSLFLSVVKFEKSRIGLASAPLQNGNE